jgi:hypothetical protein
MSSKAEQEFKELAQEALAEDYLCKPFTAEQLAEKGLKLLQWANSLFFTPLPHLLQPYLPLHCNKTGIPSLHDLWSSA